jgi:hypothetical protein
MEVPDAMEPPDMKARWKFSAEKWDPGCARNVLLHYIKLKGLEEDLVEWLDNNYPGDES